MPTYLCHGFRWHRKNIRIFAVLHDIDDAAPEWIIAPASARGIVETMRELYDFVPPPPPQPASNQDAAAPERPVSSSWRRKGGGGEGRSYGSLSLLEEYEPEDLDTLSAPYAYVADYVVRVDLSLGVAAEMGRYEARMKDGGSMSGGASDETGRKRGAKGWFERLRDELEKEEEIRWYVVVCGDEERDPGVEVGAGEDESEVGGEETVEDVGEGEGDSLKRKEGDDAPRGGKQPEGKSQGQDGATGESLAPPVPGSGKSPGRRGLRRFLSDLSLGGKSSNPSGK